MPVTFPVSSSTGNEAGEYIKEVIKNFKGLRLFVLVSWNWTGLPVHPGKNKLLNKLPLGYLEKPLFLNPMPSD